MTHDEFQDWFLYHLACFPEVRGWMKRNTPPGLSDDKQPIRAWERVLTRFDKATAMQASDALLSGEIAAKGFGAHPTAIAEFCRKRMPAGQANEQAAEGGETCRCDHGFLEVVEDGRPVSVLCTCGRGYYRARCLQQTGFRPMRHYRYGDVLWEDQQVYEAELAIWEAKQRRDAKEPLTAFDKEILRQCDKWGL